MPYLRHKPTGDLYISTALLIARTDMEEVTNKQAAGIKSAKTREARLALATEKVEAKVEAATEPEAVKKPTKDKTKTKAKLADAEEAEAAALAES